MDYDDDLAFEYAREAEAEARISAEEHYDMIDEREELRLWRQ